MAKTKIRLVSSPVPPIPPYACAREKSRRMRNEGGAADGEEGGLMECGAIVASALSIVLAAGIGGGLAVVAFTWWLWR